MSLSSLWKSLTWPDPAARASPITPDAALPLILGQVKMTGLFDSAEMLELLRGDREYSLLTTMGARALEDFARWRSRSRKWTTRRDCEKLRALGGAAVIQAWSDLYPEEQHPYPCAGRIVYWRAANGEKHDARWYLARDGSRVRLLIVRESDGEFLEAEREVGRCSYFGVL